MQFIIPMEKRPMALSLTRNNISRLMGVNAARLDTRTT